MSAEVVPVETEDVSALSDRDLIERTHAYARSTASDIAAIRQMVEDVKGDVAPMLETIMNHPMAKMFGLKK